jgi:SNF2 family DNA or RNA helicase
VYHTLGSKAYEIVHDEKIEALKSIIEEANGESVLVSYWWDSDRDRIMKTFKGAKFLDAKQQTIDDWNAGKTRILVAHPLSAGHGLNLQYGGRILANFSQTWNLEARQQIIERLGPTRQMQAGLNRKVFVYNIIAHGTLDEVALARTDEKASIQDDLMRALSRS